MILAAIASPSKRLLSSSAFSLARPFHISAMSSQEQDGPVTSSIRNTLTELLQPQSLEIINDSSKHAHHSAMRGVSSKETHFRVNVVSEAFAGKSTMQRHRLIYGALSKDFEAGLHALSLNTKTPAEIAKASEA
ncbi:BolA-like protein 1 [Entomortierella parvispora]|uniref:BolA-like protein 1 n=1 Tax=Entomortierella parvispora TaxID=205924 RepID=A0A9P3LTI6_9FUNG|nr:BolA-like protein 1 [Entomortierella parvispora]